MIDMTPLDGWTIDMTPLDGWTVLLYFLSLLFKNKEKKRRDG
jgi:hypothetical protein